MNRSRLILALAALGAAVLVCVLLFSGDQTVSAPGPGTLQPVADRGQQELEVVNGGGHTVQGELANAAARRRVTGTESFDPTIRAALAGFKGRVLTSGGEPVAGCGVRIYRFALDSLFTGSFDPMTPGSFDINLESIESITGDDGRFLIDGVLPRGLYELLAGIGTDNPTHRIVEKTPDPGQLVDLGDIVLNDAGVIIGRLIDEEGQPVGGAAVRVADIPGQLLSFAPIQDLDPEGYLIGRSEEVPFAVLEFPPWIKRFADEFPIPQTVSDAEGQFRLVGVMPAKNALTVHKKGLVTLLRPVVPVEAGKTTDLGDLTMRAGEELYGRVIDTKGEPVEGADVIAGETFGMAPVDLARAVGTSDREGRFYSPGHGRGRITVAARRGKGHGWVVAEPVHINRDVEVVLPAALTLTVRVRRADGKPVLKPELQVAPGEEREGGMAMLIMGFSRPIDLKNRREDLEDGAVKVNGLIPGAYIVLARTTGHGVAVGSVRLSADQEITLDLPAEVIHPVRVVTIDGQPVPAATIIATGKGGGDDFPQNCGRTGKDGRILVDEIPNRQVSVGASHPAYGSVHGSHELGEPELVLVMQPPGTLTGTLRDRGRPPPPGKYTLLVHQRNSGDLPEMPRLTVPDIEGHFTMRGLQPGEYRIQVMESLKALASPGTFIAFAESRWMQQGLPRSSIEIAPGETVDVQLELSEGEFQGPAAKIMGTVTLDGRAGEGLVVRTRANRRVATATVDAKGVFDLGLVPAGKVTLNVVDIETGGLFGGGGRHVLWSEEMQVEEGADRFVDITIETSQIEGYVTSSSGDLPPSALIRLDSLKDNTRGRNRTRLQTIADSKGHFLLERVPEGRYSLRAEVPGERPQRGSIDSIEVVTGLQISGLEVVLIGTVIVSGRVDRTAMGDAGARGMWLELRRQVIRDGVETWVDGEGGGVNAEGNFRIDGVVPGRYRVFAHPWGGGSDQEYRHGDPVDIPDRDVQDLVIVPVPVKPPESDKK